MTDTPDPVETAPAPDVQEPAANKPAPAPADPVAKYVKVDVEKEIMRIATIDGVTTPGELLRPVSMPRREYYRVSIYAHYRGYDQGYAECAALLGAPVRRAMLLNAIICTSVGAALTALLFLLVR